MKRRLNPTQWAGLALVLACAPMALAQEQAGSIRGMIYDKEFDVPLAGVEVTILENGMKTTATEQGSFVFEQVPPGNYTLVFAKEGYGRLVRPEVAVNAAQLTDFNVSLAGEFVEMDEFVVRDIQLETSTEAGLLQLRVEAPALMDSISSELMSKAGAGDVTQALSLVSGASVQDGKYAVVRGLPDRYVNSQLNGLRLPSADANTRAVELDQFSTAVVESVQISKTFTPDQQGDASGGAVNVVIKSIPDQPILQFSSQISFNTNTPDDGEFLTYKDGGVSFLGFDEGSRAIDPEYYDYTTSDGRYSETIGVSKGDAPINYKWSALGGGKLELDEGVKIGGFASFFYEQSSSYYKNGKDDKYLQGDPSLTAPPRPGGPPGQPLGVWVKEHLSAPQIQLRDVEQGSQEVKWGTLGSLGLDSKYHSFKIMYFYTRSAEDTARQVQTSTRALDYWDGLPADHPQKVIYSGVDPTLYRSDGLKYVERSTQALQFSGKHTLQFFAEEPTAEEIEEGEEPVTDPRFLNPVFDWAFAMSTASMDEPDKRLFESDSYITPGFEGFYPYFRGGTLGPLQKTWTDITEDSDQYALNLKLPFKQWTNTEGYLKFGLFEEGVERHFYHDTFSSAILPGVWDGTPAYTGVPFSASYTDWLESQTYYITPGENDVDYLGQQTVNAWYWMVDVPLWEQFNLIGGIRFEDTRISIVNYPDVPASGVGGPQYYVQQYDGSLIRGDLLPGAADVNFTQEDILPSIGFKYDPWESVTIRGSYAQTVARQTFKELAPIENVEYLGAEVFVGNPNLKMSALQNYDLRLDFRPNKGSFYSVSYFYKDVRLPIEYIQAGTSDSAEVITVVNYPEGVLYGFEMETRQDFGEFIEELAGLSAGANLTLISSEVRLRPNEAAAFREKGFTMDTRDMTNAPAYLYNLYATYKIEPTNTELSLFYSVRGDTLVAGGVFADSGLQPNIYETEYGTLNFSVVQKLGEYFKLKFQAKNLLDPEIKKVYRSDYAPEDAVKNSYTKGIDLSISISAEFKF